MRGFLITAVFLLFSGCVAVPQPEFGAYIAAFDKANEATKEVFHVFEPIERARRKPGIRTFDPDTASYLVDEARVGNSALILRGFSAVSDYNRILVLYAEGSSASLLKPRIEKLATSFSLLSATVGVSGLDEPIKAASIGLEAVANALLSVSDRAAFARVIKEHGGKVDRFLAVTRSFTSDMYDVFFNHVGGMSSSLGTRFNPVVREFQSMLASWVLTIDQARSALQQLEAAVGRSRGGITLYAAIYWTEEINKHAEAVKFSARNIMRVLR